MNQKIESKSRIQQLLDTLPLSLREREVIEQMLADGYGEMYKRCHERTLDWQQAFDALFAVDD